MQDEISNQDSADESPLQAPQFSRRRKILFSLIIAGFLFGAAELALRLMFPRLAWDCARYFWEGGMERLPDEAEWPPAYPKNARGVHSYIEFDVPVSFNADGFRGPDFDPAAGPVVIIVGDSTTEGHGIAYDHSFAVLVDRRLKERFGRIQVWNLGRGGSGTVIQLRLLQRILERYPTADVQAVVLVTGVSRQAGAGNDLLDMENEMPYLDGGRPPKREGSRSIRYWLRRIAVVHGAEVLLARWRRENLRLPVIENWDELWNGYYKCLDRFRAACDARGTSLIVAYLSARPTETPAEIEEVTNRFKRYLDPCNIPVIQCVPKLSAELHGKRYYFPVDGHPNTIAHHHFADRIAPVVISALEKRGFPKSEVRTVPRP